MIIYWVKFKLHGTYQKQISLTYEIRVDVEQGYASNNKFSDNSENLAVYMLLTIWTWLS